MLNSNLNKSSLFHNPMQQYYFLFVLALIFTIFAVVVDMKKREVPNWLNFSLIAFALSYRAFYSLSTKDANFFITGLIGFASFFILAHVFYYSKIFAGGDAKLLMGFGIILPYSTLSELFFSGILFIFLLFLLGALYGLFYSIYIVIKNKNKFKKEFKKKLSKNKSLIILFVLLALLSLFPLNFSLWPPIPIFLVIIPFLYIYIKSLDICMIKLLPPEALQEGDWLEKDIKLKNKIIKKSVHGLSLQKIALLKKYKKKALIKEGIPFTPAFLLSLLTMGFFFLISKLSFEAFFPF